MSGNPDSGIGKFFVEPRGPSGIRKYFARGIQNTVQEIRNTTKGLESGIQVPLTKIGIQYLEWGIHGMEFRIQGCLGFPHMEQLSLVLRLTAMNSAGSRGEARRAGPPYFFGPKGRENSFLRPLPPFSQGLDDPRPHLI